MHVFPQSQFSFSLGIFIGNNWTYAQDCLCIPAWILKCVITCHRIKAYLNSLTTGVSNRFLYPPVQVPTLVPKLIERCSEHTRSEMRHMLLHQAPGPPNQRHALLELHACLEVHAHDWAAVDMDIYPGAVLGAQRRFAAGALVSSTTSDLVNLTPDHTHSSPLQAFHKIMLKNPQPKFVRFP
jgi:hypothetical protein